MSKRGGASAQGAKGEGGMVAEPPAGPAPLEDAAALAAEPPDRPVPIPEAPTHRGALERATAWVPGPLQPAAMLLVGMARAAWTLVGPLARIAWRLAVWSSPLLIWAGSKYIKWYFFSWFAKVERVLKWGAWALSWLARAGGGGAAAA